MTAHALDRIAERAPTLPPADVLAAIRTGLAANTLPEVCKTVTGVSVREVLLPTGQTIFALIGRGDAVVTVMSDGMDVETPTGRLVLKAAPLPAGVYDIDALRYHADLLRPEVTLSSTLARLVLNRSPLHAWTAHPRLNPDWESSDRKTFDIGRAAHRAVLGKGGAYLAYPSEVLDKNGNATTGAAKEWAAQVRADGGTPLKADEVDQIGQMADAVRRRLAAMKIVFDPARSELSAVAPVDGVWCRAMLDNAPTDPRLPLYDLKSTEDASPEAVIRSVVNYGYQVQSAFYLDAWKAATGEDRRFRFVFVEKAPPYEVAVVELHDDPNSDADWMLTARSMAGEARRIWGECLTTKIWPGYPAKVAVLGAPPWYEAKWANRPRDEVTKHTPETIARAAAWQQPHGAAE